MPFWRQKETKEERERREARELAYETGTVGLLNQVGIIVKGNIEVVVDSSADKKREKVRSR